MLFLNSTPRMIADGLARQESKKVSKRKSTQGSDKELSTKEQKLSNTVLPPDPAPAPTPTVPNSQTNVSTGLGRPCEGPKLVESSLAPSQVQTQVVADSVDSIGKQRRLDRVTSLALSRDAENRRTAAQNPGFDHSSVPEATQTPAQVQAHDNKDPGPSTKKPRLSYANMYPGRRPRSRPLEAQKADMHQRRYGKYCTSHGWDQKFLDRNLLPDDLMMAPKFDLYKYLATHSSSAHSYTYGQSDLGFYPVISSSSQELIADSTELDRCRVPSERPQDLSHHPPAHDLASPVRAVPAKVSLDHTTAQISISRECCCSEDKRCFDTSFQEAASAPFSLNGKVNESCPYLDDRTFTLTSPTDSTVDKPMSSFPGFDHENNTTEASSQPITSVGTNRSLVDDCAATSLNQEEVLQETDIPETESPDTGIPDTEIPATGIPDTEVPDTEFPDTEVPDTEVPDTEIPDTDIADSDTRQIAILETATPQSDPSTLGSSLREDTTPRSLPQNSSVGPARNKGGRPRLECRKPRARKTPKGQTRLQKNHPIKATVNVDVWENILVFCPPEFLLKARTISKTFKSILKDDSLIWKRARLNYFGPDLPEPPLGLSEPQYADLITGSGCQTQGCTSSKTRKTYWAIQKRLCAECFQKSFLPPRALCRVLKELELSETPQYNSIALYYRQMHEFLPDMKFDRWDNYQWLGPTPSWGQLHRSGQYTAYPAEAYADFSSELAQFVGSEYDVEHGCFVSKEPMPGKICPSQDAIDAWFDAKRAANQSVVLELQAVENWCESQKRLHKKAVTDVRKSRESFFKEQAELAGWDKECLQHYDSYHAAIAIPRPATERSWKILRPKIIAEIMAEHEAAKKHAAEVEVAERSPAEQEAAEKSRAEQEAAWDVLLEQEDQASNWLLMPSIC